MRKIKNRVFFYNAIFALSAIDRDQENYLMASLCTIEIKNNEAFLFLLNRYTFSLCMFVFITFSS
ncbi:hypothetical protein B2M27_20065 [Kluyvera intermedia]|uniref:Uncharacterized protein n=1 Tax=Kluyvera intermedia TaxID=61648 RepID=A0ABX3UAG8_KLUIN|nr:hypothetical protein B2M27_20065 [Kluyvera intermedia]